MRYINLQYDVGATAMQLEANHFLSELPLQEAVVNCFRRFAMCIRAGGTMIFCGDKYVLNVFVTAVPNVFTLGDEWCLFVLGAVLPPGL